MRICHLSSVRESNDLCVFQRECVTAATAGYETYLVVRGENCEDRGVHIIGVGEPPESRLKRMLFFTRQIYQAALEIDADLYQIHDPELLPVALRLKRMGKKVVFDSHELYARILCSKHYLGHAGFLVAALYRVYEQFVFRRIDAVICVASIQGKAPFGDCSRRTVMVANYPPKNGLYDCYIPRKRNRIPAMCFVGVMTPDRGIENMVNAAETTGIKLILVGKIEPKEYECQLQTLPGWKYVDFRGVIDWKSMSEIYQEATIGLCVMPNGGQYNLSDTFNMKVYDYMSMGLPVILSDFPYARQVLRKYRFGLPVDPEDVDWIAAAARYLAEHPDEADYMGQEGRRAIAAEFNWETQSTKLLELYRSLIGPPES